MGIRGFLKRIQDTGFGNCPTEISHHEGPPQEAILDGPNLVFHVAQQLLDQERCVDATIWPQATYTKVVSSVIDFVKMLEGHGFAISALYFDGVLPSSKIDVRHSRLQRYVDSLSAYHTLHQATSKTAHRIKNEGSRLWNSSSLERARRALPGLPFLVPAVVEGLLKSTYAGVTYLVPGEADAFCVAASRSICEAEPHKDIVIFSNDSDLLVYNCGPQTRIVMFSGLETRHNGSTVEKLMGTEFCPAAIAQVFGKENLMEIAYHMQKDNTVTVNWVTQLMKQGDYITGDDFAQFQQTYHIDQEITDLHRLRNDPEARLNLINLDARVSELIHLIKYRAQKPAQQISMFLPFLLEDPSKKTAWYIGRRTRLIAYNLIATAHNPPFPELYEYKRSGRKISVQTIAPAEISDGNTETWLCQLNVCIQHGTAVQRSHLSNDEKWRFIIMQLALLDTAHEDLILPSREDCTTILTGHSVKSWELFHLSAQYQASYYSLRMLLQIWRHIEDDSLLHSQLWRGRRAEMQALMNTIKLLPCISDFFEPDSDTTKQIAWAPLVDTFVNGLGLNLRHSSRSEMKPGRKGKKRKMKKGDDEDIGTKWKRQISSNPFSALDGMS